MSSRTLSVAVAVNAATVGRGEIRSIVGAIFK